jgi:hypothetical protein
MSAQLDAINLEKIGLAHALGEQGYMWLGVAFFAFMGWMLYRVARKA